MSRLFSTAINLSGSRPSGSFRTTVMACEMDGSFDEPLSDDAVDTRRRCMTYVVRSADIVGIVPSIGDDIKTADGRKFKIRHVQPFYSGEFILDARSV